MSVCTMGTRCLSLARKAIPLRGASGRSLRLCRERCVRHLFIVGRVITSTCHPRFLGHVANPGALPLAACPPAVPALMSAGSAGQMLLVNAARACGDAAAAARALAAVLATMEAALGVPAPELGNLVALQARLLGF